MSDRSQRINLFTKVALRGLPTPSSHSLQERAPACSAIHFLDGKKLVPSTDSARVQTFWRAAGRGGI